jgi:hypothetical protein
VNGSSRRARAALGLILVGLVVGAGLVGVGLALARSPGEVLPESPAQLAGRAVSSVVAPTSLSPVRGRLATPSRPSVTAS